MKKHISLFLAIAFLLASFLVLPIHGEAQIYDNVIRLHVLAQSDSAEHQALKLKVRDAVIAQGEELLLHAKSRAEAEEILRASLDVIRAAAQNAVYREGSNAVVSVELGKESYPTRTYEAVALPAGEYLSLQVKIGEAEGQNWWCVLFPPLCLSAASADNEATCLSCGLTEEQYHLIADTDSTRYKLRFKILEVAQELFTD
ncbi:MAG: stage II sporulation protein R [Clostridia bacterium]|nr:stage II sporulation protein R [Clostridia bacterium]